MNRFKTLFTERGDRNRFRVAGDKVAHSILSLQYTSNRKSSNRVDSGIDRLGVISSLERTRSFFHGFFERNSRKTVFKHLQVCSIKAGELGLSYKIL